MQKIWVQSLGWGDPLEKEMATHSSLLAWRIPWTEEPGRSQSTVSQEFNMTNQLNDGGPERLNNLQAFHSWCVVRAGISAI